MEYQSSSRPLRAAPILLRVALLWALIAPAGRAEFTLGSLRLQGQELTDLAKYERDLNFLIEQTARIKAFDDSLDLRRARAVGELDVVVRGLRADFKNAAVNCTLAALKNVTKVDKIINKLPRGRLRDKITRVLRKENVQKLLKTTEEVTEAVEEGMEQVQQAQEQVEQVQQFLETSQNEGIRQAVEQELRNAVQSEIENIFPLDLEQPMNEVVVDGFIELSKHFPATAPFSGIFESTAAITKKLVRVYEQSLQMDAIEENAEDFRVIRYKHNENRNAFVDSPVHPRMLGAVEERTSFLRSQSLGEPEALDRIDFSGLRSAVSRYAALPFEQAWEFHDVRPLKEAVRKLAVEYQRVQDKLRALEEKRAREEAARAEEQRQAILAQIKEGKNRPTGRSYLSRSGYVAGPRGDFYVRPTGEVAAPVRRRYGRYYGWYRNSRKQLGLDQISRDLTGGAESLTVSAYRQKHIEYISNTTLEGRPDCSRWGGVRWRSVGRVDALSRVRVEGGLSRNGKLVRPTRPGEATLTLLRQELAQGNETSMSIGFRWQETISTGKKDSRGRMIYRTVSKSGSERCKYTAMNVQDAEPEQVTVIVTGLDRIEVRDRFGEELTENAIYDFDPGAKVSVFLDNGEVYERSLGRLEGSDSGPGYRVLLEPAPEIGVQKGRIEVVDSTDKVLLTRNFSINHFQVKVGLEGVQVPDPSLELEANLFGPGRLDLTVDGPFQAEQWKVRWGIREPGNLSLPEDVSGGKASVEIVREEDDFNRSWWFYPELEHRDSGMRAASLIPGMKRIRATVHLRAPRLRKLEIRSQNGGTAGLGGLVRGAHLFSAQTTPHGRATTSRRQVVFEAVFEDEFGKVIPAAEKLPGRMRLENSVFRIDPVRGGLSSLNPITQGRRVVIRPGTGPGILLVDLQQPEITGPNKDHRLVYHPDFEFGQKDFHILHSVVSLAQTVDFERGRPALMFVVEGPGNYQNFQVKWPRLRQGPLTQDLAPRPGGGASLVAMEEVFRFREVELINGAGHKVCEILIRHFGRSEAQREIPRPRLAEFVRPEALLAGQDNPLVVLISDLDAFGAPLIECQWKVAGGRGEFLDGEGTEPLLDNTLGQYRCTNRLRLPSGIQGATAPRVTVKLVQKGR